MQKLNLIKKISVCSFLFIIVSCSSISNKHTTAWDPIEPINRVVLQGKFEESFNLILDFSINSLAFGFINITGDDQNIDSSNFDETLTSYGLNPGPYLILPFAGPTTLRGVGGTLLDGSLDPLNLAGTSNVAKLKATELPLKALNTRAKYFDEINELKYNSIDAYSVFKSFYFQRMRAINNNDDNSSKGSYISDGAIDAFFIQNE